MRGKFLEETMHELIPKHGLNFRMKNLRTGEFLKNDITPANLESVTFNKLREVDRKPGIYYRPKVNNLPIVEAIVCKGNRVFGLNVTVSEGHPVNRWKLYDLVQELGVQPSDFALIFVVTPEVFETFIEQKIIATKDAKPFDPLLFEAIPKIEQLAVELPWIVVNPPTKDLDMK